MIKLLMASIAALFATVSAAQSTADNSGNTQATAAEQARNVKASREVMKLSKSEKAKLSEDATRLNVNPENSSGSAATAVMQRQTTAVSRASAKPNAELNTKDGRQQLYNELQKRSTP